jgi:hypothetical protein
MGIIQTRADAERVATILQNRDDIDPATRQAMLDDLRGFHSRQLAEEQQAAQHSAVDPSLGNQMYRKSAIIGENAVLGVGDTLDFLASPFTYGAMKAGQAMGIVDEDQKFFGEEGFADISGGLDRLIDGVEAVTTTEKALAGLSRAAGGSIGGVGLGRTAAATGLKGISAAGRWMAAQPVIQTGAAISGEGLRQLAAAQGASAGWQLGYALAGSLGYGRYAPRVWNKTAQVAAAIKNDGASLANQQALRDLNDEVTALNKITDEWNANRKNILPEIEMDLPDKPARPELDRLPDDTLGLKLVRNTPGGRGQINDSIEAVEEQINSLLQAQQKYASEVLETGKNKANIHIKGRTDAATAGARLKEGTQAGIRGFKQEASVRYNQLDEAVQDHGPQAVTALNTKRFFDTLSESEWDEILGSDLLRLLKAEFNKSGMTQAQANLPLAEMVGGQAEDAIKNLSAIFDNSGVGPVFTYESMKELRRLIGGKLSSPSIFADVPTRELVMLRQAVTDDIMQALRESDKARTGLAVNPDAVVRLADMAKDADDFYSTGRKFWNEEMAFITGKLTDKVAPERLFEALWSNSKIAASNVVSLKKAFKEAGRMDDWSQVAGEFITRMGKAAPGAQDAGGSRFSLETFLTNWNRLDDSARRAVFKDIKSTGETADMHKLFSDIAKIAERGRKLRQSQSARDVTSMLITGGPLGAGGLAFATSSFVPLIGMLMAGMGINGAARLMTSTKFLRGVRAISTRKNMTPAALAQILGEHGSDYPAESAELLRNLTRVMEADQDMTDEAIINRRTQ